MLSNLHIEDFALLDDWVKENRIPLDCTVPWIQEVRGLGFKVERDSCRESTRLELKANGKRELKHCGCCRHSSNSWLCGNWSSCIAVPASLVSRHGGLYK